MYDDPRPTLNRNDFCNEFIRILTEHKERVMPTNAMTSLIYRYDNRWIGGITDNGPNGEPGLTEMLRERLKCAVMNNDYIGTVSSQITGQPPSNMPPHIAACLDYSKQATIVQVGNVNVSFILSEIT